MNLIRVISHQEILKDDIKVKVTLKSKGLLRYVFSVGSKEIFSSTIVECFNKHKRCLLFVTGKGIFKKKDCVQLHLH